jgi:hypothetical protein
MNLHSDQIVLLEALSAKLPSAYQMKISGNSVEISEAHPLFVEIFALAAGNAASLPYIAGEKTIWATLSPSLQSLRAAIGDLRAWVIPSLAWEEPHPMATPDTPRGNIGSMMIAISPAGYFRWQSNTKNIDEVLAKLRRLRELDTKRPHHSIETTPNLYELRRRFQVALAIGDAEAAREIINIIDHKQLDTAINSSLMRLRLYEAFEDDRALVEDEHLRDLLQLRLPKRAVLAVLNAFWRLRLSEIEARGNYEASATVYRNDLHDLLSGVIWVVGPSDSLPMQRLAAYRAWASDDAEALQRLLQYADDPIIAWLRLQLHVDQRRTAQPTRQIPFGEPSIEAKSQPEPKIEPKGPIDNWTELATALRSGDLARARAFLTGTTRPDANALALGGIPACADAIVEFFTDPIISDDPGRLSVAEAALTALIEDQVAEPGFPRASHVELYAALLEIWSERRAKSNFQPDGQLLLTLAEALLSLDGTREAAVRHAIEQWWHARKTRGRLPWLIEALELLSEHGTDLDAIGALWIDGVDFVRRDSKQLSYSELQLWDQIGRRLDFNVAEITEALKAAEPSGPERIDPLTSLNLQKIAIVTLHERSARAAAELLRPRTGAAILTVVQEAAGSATSAALDADVILFVWAANKHAVYRAFDAVRDRLEYVQGTGPSSIILALERWVARQNIHA